MVSTRRTENALPAARTANFTTSQLIQAITTEDSQSQPQNQDLDLPVLRQQARQQLEQQQATIESYVGRTRGVTVRVPHAEYQNSEGFTIQSSPPSPRLSPTPESSKRPLPPSELPSSKRQNTIKKITKKATAPKPRPRPQAPPTPTTTPSIGSDPDPELSVSEDTPSFFQKTISNRSPETEEIWSYSRPLKPGQKIPKDTNNGKPLWICNISTQCGYSTTNYTNMRAHIRKHGVRLRHGLNTPKSSSPIIKSFNKKTTPHSIEDVDKAELNKCLVNLIVTNNLSYRTVESHELHALVDAILPGCSSLLIKTHKTVASHVRKQHAFYQEQLKQFLSTARSQIHLTCDAWTSNYGNLELLAITARFVTDDGKFHKALLDLCELERGHAGIEVAPLMFKCIKDYGFQNKLGYITSDNATCNDTMMSELSDLLAEEGIHWDAVQHRTRCFGHQINLTVQAFFTASSEAAIQAAIDASESNAADALADAYDSSGWASAEAITFIRDFFDWVKRSSRRSREFTRASGLTPVTNNNTRWNSWYSMIHRALKTEKTIRTYQAQHCDENADFFLTPDHWRTLKDTELFLKPFLRITKDTEGDNSTLDQVMVNFDFLRQHFDKWRNISSNNNHLQTAITNSRFAFERWYGNTDSTPAYAGSILFNPSFRLPYIQRFWPVSWQTDGIQAVRSLWEAAYQDTSIDVDETGADELQEMDELDRWKAGISTSVGASVVEDEFEHYLGSPPTPVDSAVKWWLEPAQQRLYPHLSRMAIDILSINPMSAESERVFSGARRTMSWDRARLSAGSLRAIECLKHWHNNLHFEGIDMPIEEVPGSDGEVEDVLGSDGDGDVEEAVIA